MHSACPSVRAPAVDQQRDHPVDSRAGRKAQKWRHGRGEVASRQVKKAARDDQATWLRQFAVDGTWTEHVPTRRGGAGGEADSPRLHALQGGGPRLHGQLPADMSYDCCVPDFR
eukprot:6337003-Pyramimonas_sp.AAC.1